VTGINIDVAGPNQLTTGGGNIDVIGQFKDTVGGFTVDNLFKAYMASPFAALVRMGAEGWNEMSGFNKDRERTYENKVKADKEMAQQKLIDDANKRKALLDEMASLAAAGGRKGAFGRSKGLFAEEESGNTDLLGL
jgi:hypothetical protein